MIGFRPAKRVSVAFTLVELLVSVGILAILIGLLLPVLRGTRGSALEQQERLTQRNSGMAVLQYTNDHKNFFPGFGKNGTDEAILPNHHDDDIEYVFNGPGMYWVQPKSWAYYMDGLGYDVVSAFTRNDEPIIYLKKYNPYGYDDMTYAAFAHPRYFSQDGQRNLEDHVLQRITTTASPSIKILLQRFNYNRYVLLDEPSEEQANAIPRLHFFMDGHSGMQAPTDLPPPMPVPPLAPKGVPGLTTLNGLLGHDT